MTKLAEVTKVTRVTNLTEVTKVARVIKLAKVTRVTAHRPSKHRLRCKQPTASGDQTTSTKPLCKQTTVQTSIKPLCKLHRANITAPHQSLGEKSNVPQF